MEVNYFSTYIYQVKFNKMLCSYAERKPILKLL